MADGIIFIKLTDKQKQQLKKATGQDHEMIKVETMATKLKPKVATKKIAAKRVAPKRVAPKRVTPKRVTPKVNL